MDETAMIRLTNDEKITEVMESKNHLELAKHIGRNFCQFTTDDEKYVDLFWEPTFNAGWLYLSDEIIFDWMGYKKTKSTISNFVADMKAKYRKTIDYKEVDKNHDLIVCYRLHPRNKVDGNRKKYFIITGETLKKMLLRAGTKQGDMTCDYFIKIEKLANFTNQTIFKYFEEKTKKELAESKKQVAKLENKQLKLESFVKNIKQLEKHQVFYLATSQNYARQSRFEYGGVKDIKDLPGRLSTYNTGRAEGDLFYITKIFKCNNYRSVEERIGNVLQQFKDKPNSRKEMLHLRYNLLAEIIDFICDNYDREVEYINMRCQEFLSETIEEDAIMPLPLDLTNYIEITINQNGTRRQKKIDITGWTDMQIDELIEEIINRCARENDSAGYDVATQKNSTALKLTWGAVTEHLNMYKGLTKTAWRDKFKEWFREKKPEKLTIKGIKI
jgi:hypothetical protein